ALQRAPAPLDRLGGRRRRDRRGSNAVAAVRGELEAGEEQGPALVDGVRIHLPATVLLGDVVLVGERKPFDTVHGSTSLLAGGRGDGHPVALRRRSAALGGGDECRRRAGTPAAPPRRSHPRPSAETPSDPRDSSPPRRRAGPTFP